MSTFLSTARPGIRFGERPQRLENTNLSSFDLRAKNFIDTVKKKNTSFEDFGDVLNEIDAAYSHLIELNASAQLSDAKNIASEIRITGLQHESVVKCLAHLKIATREVFSFEPHAEQLFAAWSMLQGCITEMQTGEGKTLTATLAAVTMALTGTPVHVITVNDYLAERDAKQQRLLYRYFDLSCRCVNSEMSDKEKRQAYNADVVYGTNKQIVFDYLRDSITLDYQRSSLMKLNSPSPIMRGLGYAVIDEADSVLIDDARVPLILAQACSKDEDEETQASVALSIASTLKEHTDYIIQAHSSSVSLSH